MGADVGSPNEEDLFGDSDVGGDDLDERALFGSDEEAGGDIDERALFGSDNEDARADAQRPPAAKSPVTPGQQSELSEMDEEAIFGEVSEDEPEKIEDVVLRRRPHQSEDREFSTMRLPNILSVEKRAFNSESIPQGLLDGYKNFLNTQNKQSRRMLNPENCIRWRFKKGADGHNLTDEDGRPQYESNARVVEWEDGSRSLFVGTESFDLASIEENVFIFEENSQDIHVCHGQSKRKLVATPLSLQTQSHSMLKRTQFRTFAPARRSLLMSQEEQDTHQQILSMQQEHSKRMQKSEARQQKRMAEEAGITAAFLEDDNAGGIGPSVSDIKRDAKQQRRQ